MSTHKVVRRIIQNFILIWLDGNIDESKLDYQNSLTQLRRVVAFITTFTEVTKCIQFMKTVKEQKIFMIVSGSLGQQIVSKIHEFSQLDSIYVFCTDKSFHASWTKTVSTVKGVYDHIKPICEALQLDRERVDRSLISISFHGIDPLFMFTQLFKEALLDIEDDDGKSIGELVEYCHSQGNISEEEINLIEREYHSHSPIWWYTAPFFIYSMLNHGLRVLNVDIIVKMGFFIRHLHRAIENLYHEQQSTVTTTFKVYRGQGLSLENFEKLKQTKGGLMSFNNFLSTSRNRDVSLDGFARPAAFIHNNVAILFVMVIDPKICSSSGTPFVDVKEMGYFKGQEEEILFSTHTIFRIDRIEHIRDSYTEHLWEVNLTLMGNNNHEMAELTEHMRKELSWTKGWSRLGDILIQIGESERAEQLYQILLGQAKSDRDRANYHLQLGTAYQNIGEYSKALFYYEQAHDIKKKTLPANHTDLAASYNNIGNVYMNMGEYLQARSFYERALDIWREALSPNHLHLAASYNNLGNVYDNLGEYSKAISFYEQALDIKKKNLPQNHPGLAVSYQNIGNVYNSMGDHRKALSFYKKNLEINEKALPPNHPDLASSYSNIGNACESIGQYSNALSFYERALDIRKRSLPPNHPDLASSYGNIGLVHEDMKEFKKAFSFYEQALSVWQNSLPPTHPHIVGMKTNIERLQNLL